MRLHYAVTNSQYLKTIAIILQILSAILALSTILEVINDRQEQVASDLQDIVKSVKENGRYLKQINQTMAEAGPTLNSMLKNLDYLAGAIGGLYAFITGKNSTSDKILDILRSGSINTNPNIDFGTITIQPDEAYIKFMEAMTELVVDSNAAAATTISASNTAAASTISESNAAAATKIVLSVDASSTAIVGSNVAAGTEISAAITASTTALDTAIGASAIAIDGAIAAQSLVLNKVKAEITNKVDVDIKNKVDVDVKNKVDVEVKEIHGIVYTRISEVAENIILPVDVLKSIPVVLSSDSINVTCSLDDEMEVTVLNDLLNVNVLKSIPVVLSSDSVNVTCSLDDKMEVTVLNDLLNVNVGNQPIDVNIDSSVDVNVIDDINVKILNDYINTKVIDFEAQLPNINVSLPTDILETRLVSIDETASLFVKQMQNDLFNVTSRVLNMPTDMHVSNIVQTHTSLEHIAPKVMPIRVTSVSVANKIDIGRDTTHQACGVCSAYAPNSSNGLHGNGYKVIHKNFECTHHPDNVSFEILCSYTVRSGDPTTIVGSSTLSHWAFNSGYYMATEVQGIKAFSHKFSC